MLKPYSIDGPCTANENCRDTTRPVLCNALGFQKDTDRFSENKVESTQQYIKVLSFAHIK